MTPTTHEMRDDCREIFASLQAAFKTIEAKLDKLLSREIDTEARLRVLEADSQRRAKIVNGVVIALIVNVLFVIFEYIGRG